MNLGVSDMRAFTLASLCGSSAAAALLIFALPQTAAAQSQPEASSAVSEVVITGSRIKRTSTETSAPVTVLDEDSLVERGYTNLGQLLNQVTSNTPSFPITTSQGLPAGNGATSPNLFNLGSGRTLTLVNGRRMVTTSSGLGDRSVSSGIVPQGLIKRVEVVDAGGAAVYGSDAIAGVVNYILKNDFQGLQVDAQYGISSRGDNPKYDYTLTWGKNFADGRGNIAVDLEYSKTRPLLETARPVTSTGVRSVTNAANTSTTDGLPPTTYVFNSRLWNYNTNGVLFSSKLSDPSALLKLNGQALAFGPDGHVVPYNTGIIQPGGSVAVGGDGLDTRTLSGFGAGLERWSGTVLGHYDITEHMKISGDFMYNRQDSYDPVGTQAIFRLINSSGLGAGPIAITNSNPFLSASDVATLSAANPGFAAGGPLYVARMIDGLPTRAATSETNTYRASVALDGDFDALSRNFYYSASFSRGVVENASNLWQPYLSHLDNALSATRNGAGQIVCSINADAITTNDDAGCVPLNPFGSNTITQAATAYISALQSTKYRNVQDDFLATFGGDIIKLPGGTAKFSVAYEHRNESVEFRPNAVRLSGITSTGTPPVNRDGDYNTNEYSGELLVPLVGGDFTFPLVQGLELEGSYRYVDNSIAGKEKVWGVGGRWNVGYGLTLRASKSRNFRAPSLDQLFAPVSSASGQPLGSDPCDADRINGGNFPALRKANCLALFTANAGYGILNLGTAANTPANRLATFQDQAENTGLVRITSGGNPDLKNEVSKTTTYGLAFQPTYIPGLTFTADRIKVFLRDGLVSLSPASFASACFDSSVYPTDLCNNITRDANGTVTAGNSFTFNAGFIRTNAEIYNLSYRFPIGRYFDDRDLGTLELAVEGTHVTLYETQTVGFLPNRTDDTTSNPNWRGRFDLRYSRGPLRLFWSVYYLPPEKAGRLDTIETTPVVTIKENYTHTVSGSYDFRNFTFRAGVNNVFDEQPSFPTRNYGDPYGRQYFMGVRAKF
jgi:iron complex outermembrane receptor protein